MSGKKDKIDPERLKNLFKKLNTPNPRIVELKQVIMGELKKNFNGQVIEVNQIIRQFRGRILKIKEVLYEASEVLYEASEEDIRLALDELLYNRKLIPQRHVALSLHTILVPEGE